MAFACVLPPVAWKRSVSDNDPSNQREQENRTWANHQFNPRTAHRDRIGPVAVREPASILARRYGVSTKTIGHWKDDFIAAGTSGLAAGKRQAVDNAKQLAALESAVAERDRVIGELTIANVILKKMVPSSPRRQFSPGVDDYVPVQSHCPANKGAGTAEY